ncbi:ribonuclease HI, putative [Rhizophagus irregularis DAOM 181602=DAOM 197198]|nr:ribonuclease HI, putative [Rhizophagus irregularis DAOM 181602=DAOM 197198]
MINEVTRVDQDNIEEVVESLTNEKSINAFLARQRLRFVKGKLNDQETKNSMFLEIHIAAHNIDGIASVPSIQKLHNLLEFGKENNIDIMAISETNTDYRDFNDTINNRIDRSPSTGQPGSQFLIQLSQLGLYDVCRSLYPDAEIFTHEKWNKNKSKSGPISKSRIDQIWITHEPDVIPVEFSHCVPDQLQDPDLEDKHQNKRIVDFSKITNVQWENFTKTLDREIEAWDFQQLIDGFNCEIQLRDGKDNDGEEIKRRFNELWDNVMSAISIAMNIELPMKLVKYPGSRNTRHKLSFTDKTMRHTTKLENYWLNRFNKYNDDYRRKEYDKFIDKYEELIIPTHDLFRDTWINNVKGVVKQRSKIDKNFLQAQRLSKIQESIEKRCNIIHSDIPKWLLSTQDAVKEHIIIDRAVISNKNESVRLAIDPKTIRTHAKDTFAGILRKRNTKSIEQDAFWSNIYRPKGEFTECIANLMDEITLEEWQRTLELINTNSAPGPSANTRPIALLDNIRKSVTKLLTNRLSTILTNNKVLRGLNFCGLKGEDTAIPLRLMNDIIEDARENGRELWMVTQDMMKAYDSVSLESLQLALRKLDIPEKFILWITELFKNRQMSVITAFGPSPTFIGGDGIDQGDAISPLLWRIFYDLLLIAIQQECNQQQGLRVPVIAYMDDTSYLDSSGDKIQASINIATQFYYLHDVDINGKKSELMVINPKLPRDELYINIRRDNSKVQATDKEIWYLGCYFSSSNSRKRSIKRLQDIIERFLNPIRRKHITVEHIAYFINHVLISRVVYVAQLMILSENEWNHLFTSVIKLVKQICRLPRSYPTSALYHRYILRINNPWDQICANQITAFTYLINSNSLTSRSIMIRYRTAQLRLAIHDNIFEHESGSLFLGHQEAKSNLSLHNIITARKLNIIIQQDYINRSTWIISGGNMPIREIFITHRCLNLLRKIGTSNSYPLIYASQLILPSGHTMSWACYRFIAGLSAKGRIAKCNILQPVSEDKRKHPYVIIKDKNNEVLIRFVKKRTHIKKNGEKIECLNIEVCNIEIYLDNPQKAIIQKQEHPKMITINQHNALVLPIFIRLSTGATTHIDWYYIVESLNRAKNISENIDI